MLARTGVEARHHAGVRDAPGHAGEHLAGGRKVGRGLCAGGAEHGYGGEHAGGCERTEAHRSFVRQPAAASLAVGWNTAPMGKYEIRWLPAALYARRWQRFSWWWVSPPPVAASRGAAAVGTTSPR